MCSNDIEERQYNYSKADLCNNYKCLGVPQTNFKDAGTNSATTKSEPSTWCPASKRWLAGSLAWPQKKMEAPGSYCTEGATLSLAPHQPHRLKWKEGLVSIKSTFQDDWEYIQEARTYWLFFAVYVTAILQKSMNLDPLFFHFLEWS